MGGSEHIGWFLYSEASVFKETAGDICTSVVEWLAQHRPWIRSLAPTKHKRNNKKINIGIHFDFLVFREINYDLTFIVFVS